MKDAQIQKAYEAAKERYAEIGVNTDAVLEQIAKVSLSLHCWQADDVTGFENRGGDLTGGIHLHTVRAPDERTLDRVIAGLKEKGFLLEEEN